MTSHVREHLLLGCAVSLVISRSHKNPRWCISCGRRRSTVAIRLRDQGIDDCELWRSGQGFRNCRQRVY